MPLPPLHTIHTPAIADDQTTCEIPDVLVASFKKFKLSRATHRAFLMKVNMEKLIIEEDTIVENISDLAEFAEEELPEAEPRFIGLRVIVVNLDELLVTQSSWEYETKDGRKTYPLYFIYYAPPTSIALNTLYASSKQRLINALQVLKITDIQDKDEFNNEWLLNLLAKG